MTSVAKHPFLSGFCSQSFEHETCPAVVGGIDCTCTCHTPSAPADGPGGPEAEATQPGHPQVPALGGSLTGLRIPSLVPGSEPWLKTMSASKVAAVLGLSPYDSRFSIWHRMANLLPPEESDVLKRGHYLEAGVLAWIRDQHPDWTFEAGGSWQHQDVPIYTAAPDGHFYLPDGEVRGVEAKTAADTDEWGEPGTDEVPAGYRAQVIWQMHVTGSRVTHVAVLSAYLRFDEYVVTYDPAEAAFIAQECAAFLDTLPGGPNEKRPSIDEHTATYEAVRKLHPLIDPVDVDLDPETVRQFCHSRAALEKAEAAATYARSLVLDELGNSRRGMHLGQAIATRQPNGDHAPKLVAGRNLPTFDQEADPS